MNYKKLQLADCNYKKVHFLKSVTIETHKGKLFIRLMTCEVFKCKKNASI